MALDRTRLLRVRGAAASMRHAQRWLHEDAERAFVSQGAIFPNMVRERRYQDATAATDAPDALSPATFRLAVKDNIATRTAPTTCGATMLANYESPFEATIVAQLRARGATVVGKTNMDAFGMGSHGQWSMFGGGRNLRWAVTEHDARSPGGSSSGSALAVAAGRADVALGTDTGGSVRLPAAYTGVVGFKPSYGMLSRHGVVPYASSLDTVGLLATAVAPIRNLVVTSGLWIEHDTRDPTSLSRATRQRCASATAAAWQTAAPSASLRGLSFGLPLEYNIDELAPGIRAAWTRAAYRLQSLGAHVVPVRLPMTRYALSAYYILAAAEASSNLAKYDGVRYGQPDGQPGLSLYAAARARGFSPENKRRVLLGSYVLSAADNLLPQAQCVRRLVRRDFDAIFALRNRLHDDGDDEKAAGRQGPRNDQPRVDFLLCPTAPTLPPLLGDLPGRGPLADYINDVFTVPASLAGLPAVSVPLSIAREDAPADGPADGPAFAGLQLIGQFWDDARLLAAAAFVSLLFDRDAVSRAATPPGWAHDG